MRVDVTEDAILLDGFEVARIEWLSTVSHSERANVQQRVASALDELIAREADEEDWI